MRDRVSRASGSLAFFRIIEKVFFASKASKLSTEDSLLVLIQSNFASHVKVPQLSPFRVRVKVQTIRTVADYFSVIPFVIEDDSTVLLTVSSEKGQLAAKNRIYLWKLQFNR